MIVATFRALIRDDGEMVAGMAAVENGPARFFVRQEKESSDAFVGRVSVWVKTSGGQTIQMQPPDLLPTDIDVATVIDEIRKSLGVPEDAPADAFDVESAALVPNIEQITGKAGSRQDN